MSDSVMEKKDLYKEQFDKFIIDYFPADSEKYKKYIINFTNNIIELILNNMRFFVDTFTWDEIDDINEKPGDFVIDYKFYYYGALIIHSIRKINNEEIFAVKQIHKASIKYCYSKIIDWIYHSN